MSRRSPCSVLVVLVLILVFNINNFIKSEQFYEAPNGFMSLSYTDQRAPMRGNPIETCIKPDDFCTHGPKGCCSGSSCRCNLWGYNCRCQINEDMSMSYAAEKETYVTPTMHNDPTEKRSSNINVYRRSCIRRGGACDHRPNECCFSSSCRCNLWGSNCRCQRVGLFQKWG